MRRVRVGAVLAALALALPLAGCGSSGPPAAATLDVSDWPGVLAAAKGQTVDFALYGGDSTLNDFVDGYVADRLARYGVKLKRIPLQDTADAVNQVLGEVQAGKTTGGSIDAIWLNGENFATGVQAGLWACGWAPKLPSAAYVDQSDPAMTSDFGTPVDGCEAPWQRADAALVYDSSKLDAADVASLDSFQSWVRAHPGRFTYPAPPDFTGSMVVRTFLYNLLDAAGTDQASLPSKPDESTFGPVTDRLWAQLNDLAPSLWRGGSTYPQDQAAVEKLYGSGAIDAYFTYGPGAVGDLVAKGQFPDSTREAVPTPPGNLGNTSFVAIPKTAGHYAAALVLADVLGQPDTQLGLYRAEGAYPAIDLAELPAAERQKFAAVATSDSVLPLATLTAHVQPELSAAYVTELESGWKTHVLQK